MIKPEDFYRDTTKALKDLDNKMDSLHTDTNKQIADLDKKVSIHIGIAKALEEQKKAVEEQEEKIEGNSNRKQYFITSLIVGGGLGAFTILSQFFT